MLDKKQCGKTEAREWIQNFCALKPYNQKKKWEDMDNGTGLQLQLSFKLILLHVQAKLPFLQNTKRQTTHVFDLNRPRSPIYAHAEIQKQL